MKKEIKVVLSEIGSFFLCLAVLIGIGFYSGYLNGLGIKDFQNAYYKITGEISNSSAVRENQKSVSRYSKTFSSGNKNSSSVGEYQIVEIPDSVIRGSKNSHAFTSVFSAKTIFYFYDNEQFDKSIKNYVSLSNSNYRVESILKSRYATMRVGDIGPSKICNSLQECNQVRQKAVDYSSLAQFIEQCGNTMCIINPYKGEYVRLRTKDYNQAIKLIETMAKW